MLTEREKIENVGVNTDDGDEAMLKYRITELEKEVSLLREDAGISGLRVLQIADDNVKVVFYTGFPSYEHFKAYFDFFGSATSSLEYDSP